MRTLFDEVSFVCSKKVTQKYSTSFSIAVKMLSPKIRYHIYNIYGFVRLADEIVDSFHEQNKKELLLDFESDYNQSLETGISLNPIINSFQITVKQFGITQDLVTAFLTSMKSDLNQISFRTEKELNNYVYGSADVVGLMCLHVFVNGDKKLYAELREAAMKLGSAFQKINFLRDLKADLKLLNRSYFPNIDFTQFDHESKNQIITNIEKELDFAFKHGIKKLPIESKFGVYIAYRYYKKLLKKLKKTPSDKILESRVRVSNLLKINILVRCYVKYKLNLV